MRFDSIPCTIYRDDIYQTWDLPVGAYFISDGNGRKDGPYTHSRAREVKGMLETGRRTWTQTNYKPKPKPVKIVVPDSQAYLDAVNAMKNFKYVEAHAQTDLILDLRRRKWTENQIGLFLAGQEKIARRMTADRKKVKAAADSFDIDRRSNPAAAIDNMFKFPTTRSQGPQYEPKPKTRHYDSKKKAAS